MSSRRPGRFERRRRPRVQPVGQRLGRLADHAVDGERSRPRRHSRDRARPRPCRSHGRGKAAIVARRNRRRESPAGRRHSLRSMPRMRSKRSKSAAQTLRACCAEMSMPCRAATAIERGSGAEPTCQPPVPAELRMKSDRSPRSAKTARNTPSASGERQILPRQTNRMDFTGFSFIAPALCLIRNKSRLPREDRDGPDRNLQRTALAGGTCTLAGLDARRRRRCRSRAASSSAISARPSPS